MTSLTYNFFVENLFGSIWTAILGTSFIYGLIMILGKVNFMLFLVLLIIYIVNMAVLVGGVVVWILFMELGAWYFSLQLSRSNFG